jgi:hypothetical protein
LIEVSPFLFECERSHREPDCLNEPHLTKELPVVPPPPRTGTAGGDGCHWKPRGG